MAPTKACLKLSFGLESHVGRHLHPRRPFVVNVSVGTIRGDPFDFALGATYICTIVSSAHPSTYTR